MIELMFMKEPILTRHVKQVCDTCHYWYFLDKGFTFPPDLCNRHHDALMMFLNPSDIAI